MASSQEPDRAGSKTSETAGGGTSLADVAAHLGLAVSTVSDALRGTGRVAAKTRERVRAVAEELGYRPDPLMSAFSRRRKRAGGFRGAVIAVIVEDLKQDGHTLSIEAAEPLGYHLETFSLTDYPTQAALAKVLKMRGIISVLFPEIRSPILLENEVWRDFFGAYCGPYPGENCPFDTVRYNAFDAVQMAWERAAHAGYRRIGLIFGYHSSGLSRLDRKSLAAFRDCQEAASPHHVRVAPLIGEVSKLLDNETLAQQWVAENHPDALIGGVAALYPVIARSLAGQREIFPFLSVRRKSIGENDHIAGYAVSRVETERLALRHLDGLIRSGTRSEGKTRLTLVIEPTWVPGKSWPEEAPADGQDIA